MFTMYLLLFLNIVNSYIFIYLNICKSHTIIPFAMTHFEQCVLNTTLVCELLVSKINDRESSFLGKHKTISEPFLNVLDQVRPIVSNLDDHVSENCNRIIFQLIFGVNHKKLLTPLNLHNVY